MGISRPVMSQFPYAWAFFIPFILIATFTILNLFIAIIVSAMQNFKGDTEIKITHTPEKVENKDTYAEVLHLKNELREIKQLIVDSSQKNAG